MCFRFNEIIVVVCLLPCEQQQSLQGEIQQQVLQGNSSLLHDRYQILPTVLLVLYSGIIPIVLLLKLIYLLLHHPINHDDLPIDVFELKMVQMDDVVLQDSKQQQ